MGSELEFNWYLVTDSGWVTDEDLGQSSEDNPNPYKAIVKKGHRVYPIGNVVPLISNNEAVELVHITRVTQGLGLSGDAYTTVEFEAVIDFGLGHNEIQQHYTDMYKFYKTREELIDDGGIVDTNTYINALERISFDRALQKTKDKQEVNS